MAEFRLFNPAQSLTSDQLRQLQDAGLNTKALGRAAAANEKAGVDSVAAFLDALFDGDQAHAPDLKKFHDWLATHKDASLEDVEKELQNDHLDSAVVKGAVKDAKTAVTALNIGSAQGQVLTAATKQAKDLNKFAADLANGADAATLIKDKIQVLQDEATVLNRLNGLTSVASQNGNKAAALKAELQAVNSLTAGDVLGFEAALVQLSSLAEVGAGLDPLAPVGQSLTSGSDPGNRVKNDLQAYTKSPTPQNYERLLHDLNATQGVLGQGKDPTADKLAADAYTALKDLQNGKPGAAAAFQTAYDKLAVYTQTAAGVDPFSSSPLPASVGQLAYQPVTAASSYSSNPALALLSSTDTEVA